MCVIFMHWKVYIISLVCECMCLSLVIYFYCFTLLAAAYYSAAQRWIQNLELVDLESGVDVGFKIWLKPCIYVTKSTKYVKIEIENLVASTWGRGSRIQNL